jgi:hypothetical protein
MVLGVMQCALGQNRTADTRFRKPLLYPLSYKGKGTLNAANKTAPKSTVKNAPAINLNELGT